MLFESRADLERAIADSFSVTEAVEVAAMIQPAVAVFSAGRTTTSWVQGDASLPAGAPWPSVDGHALVHTARIDLASVPTVKEGQPESGYLSFFDGYPWMDDLGWGGPDAQRHARVVYTLDESSTMQECPLKPDEHEFLHITGPTYVEFAPYYSIPSHGVVIEQTSLSLGDESLRRFSEALEGLRVERHTLGQLFGHVSPIQDHPTPKPWNLHNDTPPSPDAWDHLATFKDTAGIFEYYFSVRHGDFLDRSLDNISFECQCG